MKRCSHIGIPLLLSGKREKIPKDEGIQNQIQNQNHFSDRADLYNRTVKIVNRKLYIYREIASCYQLHIGDMNGKPNIDISTEYGILRFSTILRADND